jgi:hypothetical protein
MDNIDTLKIRDYKTLWACVSIEQMPMVGAQGLVEEEDESDVGGPAGVKGESSAKGKPDVKGKLEIASPWVKGSDAGHAALGLRLAVEFNFGDIKISKRGRYRLHVRLYGSRKADTDINEITGEPEECTYLNESVFDVLF